MQCKCCRDCSLGVFSLVYQTATGQDAVHTHSEPYIFSFNLYQSQLFPGNGDTSYREKGDMAQNTCKQKLSCIFDHFATVKTMLMHLGFQEITIVVSLILSSYLLMFTSPSLCIFQLLHMG